MDIGKSQNIKDWDHLQITQQQTSENQRINIYQILGKRTPGKPTIKTALSVACAGKSDHL